MVQSWGFEKLVVWAYRGGGRAAQLSLLLLSVQGALASSLTIRLRTRTHNFSPLTLRQTGACEQQVGRPSLQEAQVQAVARVAVMMASAPAA